jgi:hypothetical protein
MSTDDSESDLAGRLGASLTPRVPRMVTPQRGEQSSGLFDLAALYAQSQSVEQVMRRARAAPVRVAEVPVSQTAPALSRQTIRPTTARPQAFASSSAPASSPAWDEMDDDELRLPIRRRWVGWLGIAVAFFAAVGIGAGVVLANPTHNALLARMAPTVMKLTARLPGHPFAALAASPPAVGPIQSPPEPPAPSVAAAPPAVAAVAMPAAIAAQAQTGFLPAKPPENPAAKAEPNPAAKVDPTPATKRLAAPARLRPAAARPRNAKAASAPEAAPSDEAEPSEKASAREDGEATRAKEPKETASAPLAPVAKEPAPAKAAAAPASTSLEDMIRAAVAADAKKH